MNVPFEYFLDEVKSGFYVDSVMKRCWAAQLQVLEDLDRVCRKHNIMYYAEFGTLLGTVRHKGYIPWDDDLDVGMKRADYQKFLQIAKIELPEYELVNYRTMDEYWDVMTRMNNRMEILVRGDVNDKFYGYPMIAGIDIFPMDYLPREESAQKLQKDLVNFVKGVADSIDNSDFTKQELNEAYSQIEEVCAVKIDRDKNIRMQLYDIVIGLYSLYREDEADMVALMPNWIDKGKGVFPKELYATTVYLPYEYTKIPVPIGYHEILSKKYGNYMTCYRGGSSHDYPYYEKQLAGRDSRKVLFPKFTWEDVNQELLSREADNKKRTIKDISVDFLNVLQKLYSQIAISLAQGDLAGSLELLQQSQNLAISMGSGIEKVLGEGFVTIFYLENYCELLYQMAVAIEQNITEIETCYGNLGSGLSQIQQSVEQDIVIRKELVILPYLANQWSAIESVWKAAMEDPEYDVYVIPIPYYEKNPDGSFIQMHYEAEQFPDNVPITHYNDYDLESRHPDCIIIQSPHDEYNYVYSVHPHFYVDHIKQFTDELVYIPPFLLEEFKQEDERGLKSRRNFVTVPGVVYADQTIVQSEEMRESYIDALTQWAGEETRGLWNNKIVVGESPLVDFNKDEINRCKEKHIQMFRDMLQNTDGSLKPVVLFYVSANNLWENGEECLTKLKRNLQSFTDYHNDVLIMWCYDNLLEQMKASIPYEIYVGYRKLWKQFEEEHCGITCASDHVEEYMDICDAYYGDSGRIGHMMQELGKPIILWSY